MSRDALVVGINYYEDNTLQLTAPVEDASAIAQRLEQDGNFKVRTLLATSKNSRIFLNQLEDGLIRLFQPDSRQIPDTALFYFSGHGLQKKKAFSEGFLATSDVYPDAGLYGLALQWLRRLLTESPIKQQIIWLDCCHSGEFLVTEANPKDEGQARDRCFIAASRQFEPAYEGRNTPYSAMTKVLLEGLDPSHDPEQRVTNYTLTTYIDNHLKNISQQPIFTNFGEVIELIGCQTSPVAKPKISASDICPYKGLEFFKEEEHENFYGRTKLTDKLLAKVSQTNFLAVLGASGSGKSSLWKQRQENRLQLTTYQQLGGVGGTLDKRATAVYNQLNPQQQATVRHIFLSLTQLGEGTEDTRRRVMKSDLITAKHSEAVVDAVIQKLAQEKLLVTSDSGITASRQPQGVEVVDVPHEALIRHWKLLRQWLSESRDHLRKKRQIEAAAADWRNHRKGKDYLLQGKRLREARKFQRENAEQYPLSKQTERFIQASVRSEWNNLITPVSLLIISVVIAFVVAEPVMRQARIDQSKLVLKAGAGGKRELEYLVEGCDAKHRQKLPKDLANFLLGNCVNLAGFKFPQGLYLNQATLSNATFSNATLSNATLSNADLRYADLRYADLSYTNLSYTNLRGAYLIYVNLSNVYLIEANLSYTNLWKADLRGAYLSDADLWEADLWEANLRNTNFTNVKSLTPKRIKSACYWQEAKFDEDFQKELESSPDPETPPDCSFWE